MTIKHMPNQTSNKYYKHFRPHYGQSIDSTRDTSLLTRDHYNLHCTAVPGLRSEVWLHAKWYWSLSKNIYSISSWKHDAGVKTSSSLAMHNTAEWQCLVAVVGTCNILMLLKQISEIWIVRRKCVSKVNPKLSCRLRKLQWNCSEIMQILK